MSYITVTSKNQLTIPIDIVRSMGITKGDKFYVEVKNKKITLQPAREVINKYRGYLRGKVDPKLLKTPLDEAIRIGKERYFKNKYKS